MPICNGQDTGLNVTWLERETTSAWSSWTRLFVKPLKRENLISIIENIKQKENINIDEDAQNFIINVSNNTVKILINYMEKFKLLNVFDPLIVKLRQAPVT